MKLAALFLRILIASFLFSQLGGCTVVSANRSFPKLDWYWSHDAATQREGQQAEYEWGQLHPVKEPIR